jgi:hypothetical protein
LNAGLGVSPEEIMKNMDSDISPFQCDLPQFDTGKHDDWLTLASE